MVRLNLDVITNAPSIINCLTERELCLRGQKIPSIENMGAARDNDAIDFTDNYIVELGNFPLQPRLRTLFLAQNRVTKIHIGVSASIPNLTTLVLTRNKLTELADLDPLGGFKKLVYLTLIDNPVVSKEYYRDWVIWRCPSVRYLDFKKVRDAERRKANALFGTTAEPSELAGKIMGEKSTGFVVPTFINGADTSGQKNIYTKEENQKMRDAIKNATTLDEVKKLEKDLAEGRIPAYVLEDAEPMETGP